MNSNGAGQPPNHAVQLTPLARLVGWARSTRQNAPACWRPDNPQPPGSRANPTHLAIQASAARALPGSCLSSASSTLQTPASGAADSYTLGVLNERNRRSDIGQIRTAVHDSARWQNPGRLWL